MIRGLFGRLYYYFTGSEKFYRPVAKSVSDETMFMMAMFTGVGLETVSGALLVQSGGNLHRVQVYRGKVKIVDGTA